jgi:transposase InsO family protein
MNATLSNYLHRIYYDPNHAASYAGLDKLYRQVKKEGKHKIERKEIQKWLSQQDTHTLHRPVIRKYVHNRVLAPSIDYQHDADTAHMTKYAQFNDNYKYFALFIDIMSRYVWTRPLKNATSQEIVKASGSVFKEGRKPNKLRTDRGREWIAKNSEDFFKENNVHHFTTHNDNKASYAERAIKTIKKSLEKYMTHKQTRKWVDVLQAITDSYNHTYHRAIQKAPAEVKKSDEYDLWHKQTDKPLLTPAESYAYEIGDVVRLSAEKRYV